MTANHIFMSDKKSVMTDKTHVNKAAVHWSIRNKMVKMPNIA